MRAFLALVLVILSTLPSHASDLLPGNHFYSVQSRASVAKALESKDSADVKRSISSIAAADIDTRYELYRFLLGEVSEEIPAKNLIRIQVGYSGTTPLPGKIKDQKHAVGMNDQLEPMLASTIFQKPIEKQKEFLAILHKSLFLKEIMLVAAREAPIETWDGADYDRVNSYMDLEPYWAAFIQRNQALWSEIFPKEVRWTSNKDTLYPDLTFPFYDQFKKTQGTGWYLIDEAWQLLTACTNVCKRKVRLKEAPLLLYALKIRLLAYAETPKFKAVLNKKSELRYYPLSLLDLFLNALHPFRTCRPDLQAIGHYRSARYRTEDTRVVTVRLKNTGGKRGTVAELTAFELADKLVNEKARLEGEKSELKDRVYCLTTETERLKKQLNIEQDHIAELENGDAFRALKQDFDTQKQIYETLQKELYEARASARNVAQELEEAKTLAESYQTQNENKDQKIEKLSKNIRGLTEKRDGLKQEIGRLTITINELRRNSEMQTQAIAELNTEKSSYVNRVRQLEQQVALHEIERIKLTSEHKMAMDELQVQLDNTKSSLEEALRVPSPELQTEAADKAGEITQLKAKISELELAIRDSNQKCWQLDACLRKAVDDMRAVHESAQDADSIHINVDGVLIPFTLPQMIHYATVAKSWELQLAAAQAAQAAAATAAQQNNNNNENLQ